MDQRCECFVRDFWCQSATQQFGTLSYSRSRAAHTKANVRSTLPLQRTGRFLGMKHPALRISTLVVVDLSPHFLAERPLVAAWTDWRPGTRCAAREALSANCGGLTMSILCSKHGRAKSSADMRVVGESALIFLRRSRLTLL